LGYTNRPAYHHDQSKYDLLSSGSAGGRSYGEDISVSKMSSYSGGGGIPQSARDSIPSYDRDLARELEPPPIRAPALEKYFSSEEIKRFNEYNRYLVMSSPGRQKKFYSTLSSAEFKRFTDFNQFEQSSKSISSKAAPPIPAVPKAPTVPPSPGTYESLNPAFASSYSFSSFYEEDKLTPGALGVRNDDYLSHHAPTGYQKKYPTLSDTPPQFAKDDIAFGFSEYDRTHRDMALSRFSDFEMSALNRDFPKSSRRRTRSRSRSRSPRRKRSRSPP